MRDDPWTAANRDKEQQKVIIPPRPEPTAETASPPSKPTVSGTVLGPARGQQQRSAAGLYTAVLLVGNVVISAVKPKVDAHCPFPSPIA
jgi:hypothetical protein